MTSPNTAYRDWLNTVADPFEAITLLEKSEVSNLELSDITEALDEYVRLFQAEIASPAEVLTLSRAYPDEEKYSLAVIDKEYDQDEPVVIGGPASVEVVDREGHIITVAAMKRAFERFMANFRTRNAMVLHSDVQVGWALPAYISKTGKIYKSGVTGDHLFFITELRNDTKISKKVLQQIEDGKMKSYSIAGSATSVETVKHDSGVVMQVNDMELAEVTICEQGVNQRAKFELMKSDADRPTSSCVDGSCLIKSQEHAHSKTEIFMNNNGEIDTVGSFNNWVQKEGAMQKSHLEGCGCESCTQRTGDDDTARTATDTQGRPTLGHMGHGNVVAIMISRMQRKAGRTKEQQGAAERRQGGAYADKQEAARRDDEHSRVGSTSEGGYLGGQGTSEENYKAEMTGLRREGRGGSGYVAGAPYKRTVTPPSESMKRGVLASTKAEAHRKVADDVKYAESMGYPKRAMQKAVYEYLNKEYVVPSKEDLAEAGKPVSSKLKLNGKKLIRVRNCLHSKAGAWLIGVQRQRRSASQGKLVMSERLLLKPCGGRRIRVKKTLQALLIC